MDDERDLPADQAAADEIDRIYKDQSHPQHAAFWKNDRAAVEYRDRLLARAWPLKPESGADPILDNPGILAKSERTPGQLEPQPSEPLSPDKAIAADTPAESNDPYEFTREKILDILKPEWGPLYDFNLSRIQSKENQEKIFLNWVKTDEDREFVRRLTWECRRPSLRR